jgi:AbrB family looped-hinge helix DNA binding protein
VKILGDSKVTGRFQATIPKAVRDLLALEAGDRLVFVAEQKRISLKKARLELQT